jgi:hypothetical protein
MHVLLDQLVIFLLIIWKGLEEIIK